jgi:predicted aconitase
VFPAVLGHLIGHAVGSRVPAVIGLDPLDEDQLKALGSAAASSGSVGLFHVVGTTPEAPTLSVALGDRSATEVIDVSLDSLRAAWSDLSTVPAGRPVELGAVSLGTPHYSVAECGRLVELLGGRSVHPDVTLYVNLGRTVLTEISLRGWTGQLEQAGVQLVTDTCTYITPVMAPFEGVALTDSPKWAYYAPGNLGVDVVFASTADCVESAVAGRLVRGTAPW